MTDLTTFQIPTVAQARAAGLDPEEWDPVLDIDEPAHRLALALNAELPIMVPTWLDLGFTRLPGEWELRDDETGELIAQATFHRMDSTWETFVPTTDEHEGESLDGFTDPEARWYFAVLAALAADVPSPWPGTDEPVDD